MSKEIWRSNGDAEPRIAGHYYALEGCVSMRTTGCSVRGRTNNPLAAFFKIAQTAEVKTTATSPQRLLMMDNNDYR